MAGGCQCQHRPCRPCCCRCCLHLRLRLCLRLCLLLPAGCLHARRHTSCRRGGVGEGARAIRNGLMRAPQTTVVARGQKGGGGEDDLKPRFGQWPPHPPSLSAATIVTLVMPPSSSIIAITIFLSLGCNAAMRSLAGEEGGAPASAPVSPVKRTSLPLLLRS